MPRMQHIASFTLRASVGLQRPTEPPTLKKQLANRRAHLALQADYSNFSSVGVGISAIVITLMSISTEH